MAGIEKCNLVSVSSIFPAGCKRLSKEEGLKLIEPGQITFCVMARNSTNEPNRLIASSIGVALPKDENQYGYISEHHPFGEPEKVAGDYAEDPQTAWDEREQLYKASGQIYKTFNVTQSAEGDKSGIWTTVIASAVMLP